MSDDDSFDEVGADGSESADADDFEDSSSEEKKEPEQEEQKPPAIDLSAAKKHDSDSESESSSSFSSESDKAVTTTVNAAGAAPLPRSPRPLDLPSIAKVMIAASAVKEGYLKKKGSDRRNWPSRWCILTNTALTYWEAPDKEQKGELLLNRIVDVQPHEDNRHPFSIAISVSKTAVSITPAASTSLEASSSLTPPIESPRSPRAAASSSSAAASSSSSSSSTGSAKVRLHRLEAESAEERDAWVTALRTAVDKAKQPKLLSPRSARTPRDDGLAATLALDPGAVVRTGSVKIEVSVGGSSASFKSVWLVLTENHLTWWASQRAEQEEGKKPIGSILRSQITEPATVTYTNQKFTLRVPTGPEFLVIAGESTVDRDQWIAAINHRFTASGSLDARAVPGSFKLSFMRGEGFEQPIEAQFKIKLPNKKSFLTDLSKKSSTPVWRNAVPLIVDPSTQVYPVHLISARKKKLGTVEVILPTSVEQEQPTWYNLVPPQTKKSSKKPPISGRVLLQVTRTSASSS